MDSMQTIYSQKGAVALFLACFSYFSTLSFVLDGSFKVMPATILGLDI